MDFLALACGYPGDDVRHLSAYADCDVVIRFVMVHESVSSRVAPNFVERSKILHLDYSQQYWAGAFDPEHPDTRRHYAMLGSSDGLLTHLRPRSILTVGDNLARDAGFFKKRFPEAHCIATDLYVDGILKAAQEGWVDEVLPADVEKLPFPDESIDCVIAKEAFHHWPRPLLGFYEMLRVARKAIVLIEPNDVCYREPAPWFESSDYLDEYEPVGNYKYQISLREILKAAWSLYLPAVAAVGFNDPYAPDRSVEEWEAEKRNLDALGDAGQRQYNLLAIVVYKEHCEPEPGSLPARAHLYTRPLNPFQAPASPA